MSRLRASLSRAVGSRRAVVAPVLMVALVGLELILVAGGMRGLAPTGRALVLLACGLGIGTFPLLVSPPPPGRVWRVPRAWFGAAWLGLAALVAADSWPDARRAMRHYPLDPALSDIYPQVTVNIRHLLEGDHVYAEHAELGRPIFPTWLPMQWLPFLLTTAAGIDHRWLPPVAFGTLLVALGLADIRARPPGPGLAIALAGSLLVPWLIVGHRRVVTGWTMELLIGAYYLLLAWSLRERSPGLAGVGLGLCLLSRYALAPWTLLLSLTHFVSGSLRPLLRTAAVAGLLVAVFYGIPFLARDPGILRRSYDSYGEALAIEWARPASESHLHSGYGLAGWVSDRSSGDSARRFERMRELHLAGSFGVVVLLAPLVALKARRLRDPYLPALYSLKAALAVFYVLVPVPYPYLWVVPAVLSSQVLAAFVLPPRGGDAPPSVPEP